MVLVRSHFFFFINDVNFFIKQKFVCLNGCVVVNKFTEVKPGDCIQLIRSDYYYDYMSNIDNFFKMKMKRIKYRR